MRAALQRAVAAAASRCKQPSVPTASFALKTPWRNDTTHIILTPMEFMRRLAALIPRPRLHLIRFHGVLAANAKLRSKVVPVPPQETTEGEGDCQSGVICVRRHHLTLGGWICW